MHQVVFGEHLEAKLFSSVGRYSKIAVLADENTFQHCYPLVKPLLPEHHLMVVPAGEEFKTLDTCSLIYEQMTDFEMDRRSVVLNLGGGVIGDMGGFCAATFKRGVAFIQVPTTLLAQVDASVGGKLGIDFRQFKNHIGVFREPERVIIHTGFLDTLPFRQLRSGFAEVIKHCLIQDARAWEVLCNDFSFETAEWNAIVSHSVAIKSNVVAQDPEEKGLRKILNFGHTVGHAIETTLLQTPGELLHGEAIAIGMICEAWLSHKFQSLSKPALQLITEKITDWFGCPPIEPALLPEIVHNMRQDKKNVGGRINFSLLNRPGQATFDTFLNEAEIMQSLEYYLAFSGQAVRA